MIARDEAKNLPACLASVRGVVDEIIVCDTGSVDDTVAIAQAAGARVVHFPWVNDFSAARNAALAAATGDWILSLDADERLAPGEGPALRAAIEDPGVDCIFMPLHDASRLDATPAEVLSGAARLETPVLLPRLLRRTPDLCWREAIHENIDHWMAPREARCQGRRLNIVHYGAVPSLRADLGKSKRNRALLEAGIAADPGNLRLRGFLLYEHGAEMPIAELRASLAEAWAHLTEQADRLGPTHRKSHGIKIGGLCALLELSLGDAALGRAVVRACEAWGVDHPNLWWAAGRSREWDHASDGDPRALLDADHLYSRCLTGGSLWSVPVLAGVSSWRSALRRGIVRVQLGRLDEAETDLRAASEGPAPFSGEAGVALALIASLRGDPRQALQGIKPLLASQGPDGWLVAARCVLQIGGMTQARDWLGRSEAAGRPPAPYLLPVAETLRASLAKAAPT